MRIRREIYWTLLMVVGLTAILTPCFVLAQAEKTGLTLNIVPDGYYNTITAGQEKTIYLEMANTGGELKNIRLSTDAPKDWTVEFSPGFIDSMAQGSVQTVEILLRPAGNAAKGEYDVAVIAEASEMRRVTSFYVRVEATSLFWVWVGTGIAGLLIAGFVVIFIRFGREEENNALS